jgi:hypothetical protein
MARGIAVRAALATAALVFVSGCNRDTEFDIIKVYNVQTNALAHGPEVQTVNLAEEAGSAWDHRDKLKSVTVKTVTAVASNVNPAAGTVGSGSAALRRGASDIPMGSWSGVPIVDGSLISAGGTDALNNAFNDALNGDGQLAFVLAGNANNEFSATVTVTVHVEVEYSISPF